MTYPLSLHLFFQHRKLPLGAWPREERPTVAICMSAYNEASVIVQKVESLLRIAEAYGPATIHIYTDGCSDNTAALLEPYRDRIDLVVSQVRSGKTFGMNELVNRSRSELLMFNDANVEIPDDALLKLAAPFVDPDCGCATARLHYVNNGESSTSLAGGLYWQIEEWVKSLESATLGLVGVDGASFVVRRDVYTPAAPDLIDDLYVTLHILLEGKRVVRAPDIVVFERNAVNANEERKRKVRIACQAMNVHKAMWPRLRQQSALIQYGYISHRLIKWMIPFIALAAGLSLVAAAAFQFGALPTGIALLALLTAFTLGFYFSVPIISLPGSIVISLAGVGQGVLASLLSRQTFTTWEPAATVREATKADPKPDNRHGSPSNS